MKEDKKDQVLTLASFSDYEVDGIDHGDFPDYCDAFISEATLLDGTQLTEFEMDSLPYGLVSEMVQEYIN